MHLLVCAATARELAALAPHDLLDVATHLEGHGTCSASSVFNAPAGIFASRAQVHLTLTGVGPVNAALALGHALAVLQAQNEMPDLVINIGLAGAYDLCANPLRSLCLVREEIWPEYGLHDGTSVTAEAFSWPMWARPAEQGGTVYDRLLLCGTDRLGDAKVSDAPFSVCRSLTVAGVSASVNRSRELQSRYQAHLENMEGFAVAYACARYGIPCLEIRSVSNKVGPRARHEKDFPGALDALGEIMPLLHLTR